MLPMLPASKVPREKSRVRFLQDSLETMSLRVSPAVEKSTVVQPAGLADWVGMPVKPLRGC